MTIVTFSLQQKICDSDFTVAWLLDSLNKNDKIFMKTYGHRKVSNITARDISGGKGMFSIVLKCELTVEDSKHENDIYTTIIKIPGTGSWEAVHKDKKVEDIEFGGFNLIDKIVTMHQTECDFYEIIGSYIPEILPRVFKTQDWIIGKHQGCLHMEDLSKRGTNLDYYHSLSHGQLKNIIKQIAYFHKTIMCLDECTWKGKFLSQKFIFLAVFPTIKELCQKFLEMSKKTTALKKVFEHPKVQKIMCNPEYVKYVLTQAHLDIGIPDLLVHADLWSSNIIFVADEDGNATDQISAILDWQIVHEGNMLLDFVRLMINSLDGDTRREAEIYIFDFYIDQLNKYLAPEGKKAPYTVEQVKKAYEYMYIAHFVHAVFMPGGILSSRPVKPGEERAEEARIDKCALRSLHVVEDAIVLLETGQFDEWL